MSSVLKRVGRSLRERILPSLGNRMEKQQCDHTLVHSFLNEREKPDEFDARAGLHRYTPSLLFICFFIFYSLSLPNHRGCATGYLAYIKPNNGCSPKESVVAALIDTVLFSIPLGI